MSKDLTADIIVWREQNGWSWGRIAERARLSRAAVRQRYIRARGQDERSIIAGLRAELAAAHTLIADLESRLGEAQQGLYVMEEQQQ